MTLPDDSRNVDFSAPAILRKWPSLNNQRRTEGTGPYLLFDGTLGDCIREFVAKPAPMRHLYEIHTSPHPRWWVPSCRGEYHHRTRAASGFSLMILPLSPLVTGLDAVRHLGNGIATRNPERLADARRPAL